MKSSEEDLEYEEVEATAYLLALLIKETNPFVNLEMTHELVFDWLMGDMDVESTQNTGRAIRGTGSLKPDTSH